MSYSTEQQKNKCESKCKKSKSFLRQTDEGSAEHERLIMIPDHLPQSAQDGPARRETTTTGAPPHHTSPVNK